MVSAWLGLGTNLGDREENLRAALAALQVFGTIAEVSSIYLSEPVGFREQPDFWNMALRFETDLDPEALLAAVKGIESSLGRRTSFRGAPRIIDIDILLYGDAIVDLPGLVIPHPALLERAFVLRPLTELDPTLRHPATGTLLLDHLSNPDFERTELLFPGTHLTGT